VVSTQGKNTVISEAFFTQLCCRILAIVQGRQSRIIAPLIRGICTQGFLSTLLFFLQMSHFWLRKTKRKSDKILQKRQRNCAKLVPNEFKMVKTGFPTSVGAILNLAPTYCKAKLFYFIWRDIKFKKYKKIVPLLNL